LEDEIDESPERYLRLPTNFEIHEYLERMSWNKSERGNCISYAKNYRIL
jgi:hypothetical protein